MKGVADALSMALVDVEGGSDKVARFLQRWAKWVMFGSPFLPRPGMAPEWRMARNGGIVWWHKGQGSDGRGATPHSLPQGGSLAVHNCSQESLDRISASSYNPMPIYLGAGLSRFGGTVIQVKLVSNWAAHDLI